MRKIIILALAMLSMSARADNEAKFASVMTDNMVLQQKSYVNVWGFAKPGERLIINCSWNESEEAVITDKAGIWAIKVKTPNAGFSSHTISLTDSKGKENTLKNILIGEVWLCSGQSNMEMILMSQPAWNLIVENSEEEISNAKNPYLRLITIGRKESFTPIEDAITDGWKECTPENAKWFSAVAYFFVSKLMSELNVPVGIIVSSYGGSPIQSWIPDDIMKTNTFYKDEVSQRNAEINISHQSEDEYISLMSDWISDSEKKSTDIAENDSIILGLPVNLEKSPICNQLGEVSFTKTIVIYRENSGKDLHINLGTMDDIGRVYFNGDLVWEEIRNSKSYSQVTFTVPAEKIKPGLNNVIEARVLNILWGGGLTGPEESMFYTIGRNTEKISLAGPWHYKKIFDLTQTDPLPLEGKPLFSTAGALYNGMINPILRYTFKGFLWYQGEGNVSNADKYSQMLSDMVLSWRNNFGNDLPFYYVQIAPYQYDSCNSQKAAELREAQSEAEHKINNTGMIVTMDIGETTNIHPAKKKEVGERLACKSLSETYHKYFPSKYPEVKDAKAFSDTIYPTFSNVYNGLISKSKSQEFEVSEDGIKYFTANANIKGNRILVYSQGITKPGYVRYCWRDAGISTIFNSENLPLTSFRIKVSE